MIKRFFVIIWSYYLLTFSRCIKLIEAVFRALGAGLEIWASKEKTRYKKKWQSLQEEYYEECNKPKDRQDYAKIDNIEFELYVLVKAFSDEIF